MGAKKALFGKDLFAFLQDLERNNDKGWFERNKERYEREVREPALALIRALEPRLERISPHLLASDKRVGGSLMRIHRDVRFSRDKSPYKTNLGIQFRHESGKDAHAPGLYMHVQPGECFLGAGMWQPDAPSLRAVRDAIVADPEGWKKVRDDRALRRHWSLAGDALTRPPRGFDADHPLVEDLKRKDFVVVAPLDEKRLVSPDLVNTLAQRFREAGPWMAFQTRALGLPF